MEEKQSTVQIKKEPLTTPDTATEIAQVSGGSTRKSKYSVTEGRMRREAVQDQVVFGGGIGGMKCTCRLVGWLVGCWDAAVTAATVVIICFIITKLY